MIFFWRLLAYLLHALGMRHILNIFTRGKVSNTKTREHLARMPKNPIWIHAASIGEVQVAMTTIGFVWQQKSKAYPFMLSVNTEDAEKYVERFMPYLLNKIIFNFWESPVRIKNTLDRLTPQAYIVIEKELWPLMLYEVKQRNIPAFLINGRMSESRLTKMLNHQEFWCGVMACFTHIIVRLDADKENFMKLGVPKNKISVGGDCKLDFMHWRKDYFDSKRWNFINFKPLFVAGSVHYGEERILCDAYQKIRNEHPDAKLVLAPRYMHEITKFKTSVSPYGKIAFLSEIINNAALYWDILIVDSIGDLFELYSLSTATFVGGSFIAEGGHNVTEPAIWGKLVTSGPHIEDCPEIYQMEQNGIARIVNNADELTEAWICSMNELNKENVSKACKVYFSQFPIYNISSKNWDIIDSFMKNIIEI